MKKYLISIILILSILFSATGCADEITYATTVEEIVVTEEILKPESDIVDTVPVTEETTTETDIPVDETYQETDDTIIDNESGEDITTETVFEETTTEVVTEEETEPAPKTFDFVVTFTGDVMLASYKDQTTSGSFNEYVNNNDPSYFFEKMKPIFEQDDYTIVNLENVFTDNKLTEVWKDHDPAYWYKSKTSNTEILTSSSIEAVSLANNHYGDYGTQGRRDTDAAVESAGLLYGHNDKTFYIEKNGFTIAVICHGLWSGWQADQIIERINAEEEKSDFQIVFYHGGTERIHKPEDWKVKASRKLVDAGADLVVGNHPHVLQPIETYNGVDIIYSMGNFCFGGSKRPENRTIVYQLKLTINNDNQIEAKVGEIIPCYVYTGSINNYQPAPVDDETIKQKILDFMYGKINSPV